MPVLDVRLEVALAEVCALTGVRLAHEYSSQTGLLHSDHFVATSGALSLVLFRTIQTKYMFARDLPAPTTAHVFNNTNKTHDKSDCAQNQIQERDSNE
jgi:hypothetical protein